MSGIVETITSGAQLSATQLGDIASAVRVRKVHKGTMVQQKGDASNNLYFVKKGLLRMYLMDAKDKERIFMFAPEGWILSDFYAQVNGTPSDFYIDALEPSEIEICTRALIASLPKSIADFGITNVEKMARRIAVLQKRVVLLLSATPWERYQHFLETYPTIANRVPQKMIASYLGITPEALSSIRRKHAMGK